MIAIGQETIKAARWNIVATVGNYLGLFINIVLLARFVAPVEHGIAAIAVSTAALFILFSQFGFSQALIGLKEVNKRLIDTIFTVSFLIALFLYTILFFIAPLIAQWYRNTFIASLLLVSGIGLFLSIATAIPFAILQRALNYRAQTIVTLVTSLATTASTFVLAVKGFGVWALVVPVLIGSFIGGLMAFVKSRYVPSFLIDFQELRRAMNFGISGLISNVSNYICGNIVPLVMGITWSSMSLGFYSFAEKQYSKPLDIVSSQLVGSLFPLFSKISDDIPRIRLAYLRLTRIGLFFLLPLYSFIILGAPAIFPLLFGPQWNAAILPFQIFCIIPMVRSLGIGSNGVLYSLRLPHLSARVVVFRLIGYVIGIIFAFQYGFDVVPLVILFVTFDSLIVFVYLALCLKNLHASLREFFSAIAIPIILSALLFFVLFFAEAFLKRFLIVDILRFFLAAVIALLIYFLVGYQSLYKEWLSFRHYFHSSHA